MSIQPRRAAQKLGRIDEVLHAPRMNVDLDPWIFADQRARGRSVIEVNVREKNRVQVPNGYTV